MKSIKKTYECVEYIYDAELKTVYATYLVEGDSYWSRYTYDTLVHEQGQYLSEWFSWESRESPSEGTTYTTSKNMINDYTLPSILIFYIIVLALATLPLLFTLCRFCNFCKKKRIPDLLLKEVMQKNENEWANEAKGPSDRDRDPI